jgi:hypothetical protein
MAWGDSRERPMLAVTRRGFQSDLEHVKRLMESGRITP